MYTTVEHDLIEQYNDILIKDLNDELKKNVEAGTTTPESICNMDKATDLMLDLLEIDRRMNGEGEDPYEMGYSNRRGRSMTTGRYVSRDSAPMRSYDMPMDGYSNRRYYDDPYMRGYSGHSNLEDELSKLYMNSTDEHERNMIKGFMNTAAMGR